MSLDEMAANAGLTELVDILKVKSLIFTPDTREYYAVGRLVGQAFSIGENICSHPDPQVEICEVIRKQNSGQSHRIPTAVLPQPLPTNPTKASP